MAEQDVSSPNLYHFTRKLEYLKGILKDKKFRVSICKERYPFIQKNLIRDIPMVCFCDLPKGARETHKERYGYYAISFKKEWANKYKICPVIYCRQKGKVSDYIRMIYNNPLVNKQLKDGLLNYCKPTRGIEFIKEQQKWSDYKVKFLDEREWRYTPKKNDVNTSLPFTLDDILNVYVKDETEISELFGLIDKAKIKVSSKK